MECGRRLTGTVLRGIQTRLLTGVLAAELAAVLVRQPDALQYLRTRTRRVERPRRAAALRGIHTRRPSRVRCGFRTPAMASAAAVR